MENNFQKNFYEKRSGHIKQLGFLSFFYYKLQRFETHRHDAVANLIEENAYKNILDIGCDKGSFLMKIKQNKKINGIFGTDISTRLIEVCKEKFSDNKENFSVQNIDNGLDFKDNFFELITMIAVLEHVFDPVFAVKEIGRILKPGGIFIVEVPNVAFIRYRINLLFGIRPRTSWGYGWDGGHLGYFTRRDLKKLLKENGFEILNVTGSGIFCRFRKFWGNLLLPNIIIKAKKI